MSRNRRSFVSVLAVWTALVLLSPGAVFGVEHEVRIYLDVDENAATGCSVATVEGPFDGAEHVLISTVDTTSPPPAGMVTDVAISDCVDPGTDTFGPPASFDGGWPIGVDNGVGGRDVVETYFPLAASVVPNPTAVRLGVVVTDEFGGEQALLTTDGTREGDPIVLVLDLLLAIPTLGEWALILLALLLAGASVRLLGRRGTVAFGLVALTLAAGTAWAAASLDGLTDEWFPNDQLASNGIVLFGKKLNTDICFRVDVALLFNTSPTADPQAVVTDEDTPVAITLTGSDPESDPLTFSIVPGTGPDHGTLTGTPPNLTYTPDPDYEGPDSFDFQVEDPSLASDTATVSITVTGVNDAPVVDPAAFSVPEDATVGTSVGTVTFSDPDAGQSHTFAITAGNTGGAFAIGATTGVITVAAALDFETLAAYSLTVEVTDDGAPVLSGSATVDVTVTDTDDPPVAVDDAATVTEDDPATTIDVLANDTDVDGGPISIQSVTQPANGTVVITNAGADLTYQPDADYCNDGTPTDDFTYTLNGGSTGTVAVTVTCVDDDPVAVDDAATVAEDAAATTVDVLANDTDVDGGPISVQSVTQPTNGTVVITNAGADLTYQPDADYCNDGSPLDTFTYTLTPGGSTATVSMTVTCVDDAPVAVADAATVGEDSGANAIDVLANDTDLDGGPKTVQSVTQPTNGTVAITGGGTGVSYAPNANYCNDGTPTDDFTYTLNGGSSTTVAVTVTCVDDPPLAVDDTATVGEDSGANPIDVLLNDTDIDAGTKQVTVVQSPSANGGTVTITGGGTGVAYSPAANYCNSPPGTAPDIFTYTLNGGSTATVSVTVTCVDDAPVLDLDADDDKGTGGANFAVAFTEGDPPTLLEDPDDPTGATITDIDSTTLVSLTVTLTNLLDAGEELLDADVSAFAPDITKDYDTTTPGVGVLTIASVTPQPIADYVAILRTVTYDHTGDDPDATARVVQFVANDGTSDSNTATSTVTLTAVDDPPVAVADSATVAEDSGATTIDVLVNDTDVDAGLIEIQSVTQPANGTVVITNAGADLTYEPDPDYCNDGTPTDDFTYTLNGGSSTTVEVTVTCADDPPTAVADTATVTEDSGANAIAVLTNDTDPDGGPKTVQSVTQPTNGTVAITGGGTGISYTPNANYCNDGTPTDDFTYTLNGGSSTTVAVTVTCVDDDPVAVADAATVAEDSGANAIDVLTNDTDVDGGPISIQSVTQPAGGSVAITGGGTGVSYTPNANFCNDGTPTDDFTYTLNGGSSTTVAVTVTCVDDPPVAVADAAMVNEDSGANAIDVLANDTDIDAGPKTVQSVTQPTNGTVVITGGGTGLTYAPALNYCNDGSPTDDFTYTLNGGSSTSVAVTVVCVNDPPVAAADSFDFLGNTELRLDQGTTTTPHALETTGSGFGALDNDADPVENDSFAVTSITVGACTDSTGPTFDCTDAAVGTVHMDPDGSFSFEPAPGDTGATESFTYTITDDGTPAPASAVGTVTLNRFERIWYVDPNAGAGDGTSDQPFNTLNSLDGVGGAGDSDVAGDYIFVHDGTLALAATMELEANQHLIGEGEGLSIPVSLNGNGSPTVLVAAGTHPQLTNAAGDAVTATEAVPVEIVGLSLQGSSNAIDLTTDAALTGSATLTIDNNVIRGASTEGIDVTLALGTTGTLSLNVTGNTWNVAGTHTGPAIDINRAAGSLRLDLSNNTNVLSTGATAINVADTTLGNTTITGFAGNSVHQNTAGAGVSISNVTFDAVAGGAVQQVDGDNLAIGVPGDPVGGAGMTLSNVQGNLFFDDLDVFGTTGGLSVDGTGTGTTTFAVTPASPDGSGTSVVRATNGAALDVRDATVDLRFDDLDGSTTGNVSVFALSNVAGQVKTDGDASLSKTGGTGTGFSVASSSANVTYAGTLNVTSGGGVSLTSNSGTMSFSGGMTLSTGANTGFNATGGGTVTVTDPAGAASNTITTITGTALNVASTTIGASGLTFESINVDGNDTLPTNGIVMNTTGSVGGLTVTGTGAANSGGTIRDTGGDAISLTSTGRVSLTGMNVTSNLGSGIRGATVNGFVLASSSVTSNGDSAASDESGVFIENLSGTASGGTHPTSITNSTISNNWEFEVQITNNAGSATTLTDLVMSGNTISADGTQPNHGNLMNFLAVGTGPHDMTLNLTGGSFTGNTDTSGGKIVTATGLQCDHSGSAGTITCNVSGATFTNNNVGPQGSVAQGGEVVVDFNGNTITGSRAIGINFFADANAPFTKSISGHVRNNVIGTDGVANSGSQLGPGIRVQNEGSVPITLRIENNTVQETQSFQGINVNVGISTGSALGGAATNLTIFNNSFNDIGSRAIVVQDNDASTGAKPTVCVDMSSNFFGNGIAGQAGDGSWVRIRELSGTVNVRQAAPTTAVNAAELDDQQDNGNDATGTKYSISGSPQFSQGACLQP